jgi:aspartate racemase
MQRDLIGVFPEGLICSFLTGEEDSRIGILPFGRPIANTQIYILDKHLELVPIGVAGELKIGGMGLARGSLGRPDLTAQRFLSNPHSTRLGGRMYKSGDLARFRPDGNIEFLRRADHQVKIRGFRVELGEIEAVLSEHPGLRECVTLAREEARGGLRIEAYVVPHGGRQLFPEDMRRHLRAWLPEYMLPSRFVTLPHMPLTPNGKVDRQVLGQLKTDPGSRETPLSTPSTELERVLGRIWEETLDVEGVGINKSFLDAGGTRCWWPSCCP